MNVGFSMTLHGSDLLLSGRYLDLKLVHCDFCITISEYNRNYILKRFPQLDSRRIIVSRLGVEIAERIAEQKSRSRTNSLSLLAVGRLHAVKDHVFLLRACAELIYRGISLDCRIAGDGPERRTLEFWIRKWSLQDRVTLLGHVARESLAPLYEQADVVVLTSRSEGIPLVLMEAMARGTIVLAPAITGIPELVRPGETGFLYQPGSLRDCVAQLEFIHLLTKAETRSRQPGPPFFSDEGVSRLDEIRRRAAAHIRENFNRERNLGVFCDLLIRRIAGRSEKSPDANFILQQI
jgi:glycosyltransferase involved in cell wall biosynthesis